VNLAARLCAQAGAGQVLLDQATHLATHASVPSSFVGTYDLKGFSPATRVFGLDGEPTSSEVSPLRHLRVAGDDAEVPAP